MNVVWPGAMPSLSGVVQSEQ